MVNIPRTLLAAALLSLFGSSSAADVVIDDIHNFCAATDSSVTIVDQKAYIFGGHLFLQGLAVADSDGSYDGPNNLLRIIDFSSSFSLSGDISTYVQYKTLPVTIPRTSFTCLWPTQSNTLDAFLGFHETSAKQMTSKNAVATKIFPLTSKQRYDISSNTWTSTNDVSAVGLEMYTSHTSPDSDGTLPKVATGMSTYVQSLNRGYAMGGLSYRDNLPSTTQDGRAYMAHRGLLKYDQKADAWTNSTMPIDRVRQGVLTHLKSDTGEILITFAGSTQDPTTSESQASMRTMREFNIYNIAESKWLSYLMPSSAVFPDPRSDLCWSVVSAQDGSSHQIIIYGGYSPVNGERVADGTVWALSIPSFDWVQLSSGGTGTGYPGTRSQPACTTVGNKYMLVWGGLGNNCSKDGNAVYLFDISNREWVVDFTAGQDYLIPEPVVVAIGGSRTGGATKLAPTGGFGDPALEKLMKFSKADSSTSADSDSSSTSGDNSSLSPKITTAPGNLAKKTNTGPIAGGVIGGLAVLGALGFGIFLLKRNKGRAATIAQGQAREREDMEQSAIAVHEVHEAPDNQKFAQIYEAPSETRYYGNIPELSNTRQ